MDVRNAWYGAAWGREIGRKPLGRVLLDREVVLVRDDAGRIRALGGVCPHRQSRLCTGALTAGHLQCPYHGWEFDLTGRCVHIPTLMPGAAIPIAAQVPAYPVVEQQGLVWIWMGDGPADRQPPSFDFDRLGGRYRRQDLPGTLWDAGFVDLVENALDPSHIPTVHPATLGPNWSATVGNVEVTADADGRGFSATSGAPLPEIRESWRLPNMRDLLRLPRVQRADYRFDFGGTIQVHYSYSDGGVEMAFANITPSEPGKTWVFFGIVRSRMRHAAGDLLQAGAMKLLQREDIAAIRNLSSRRPASPAQRVSVESDRMGNLFVKLRRQLAEAERAAAGPARLPIACEAAS